MDAGSPLLRQEQREVLGGNHDAAADADGRNILLLNDAADGLDAAPQEGGDLFERQKFDVVRARARVGASGCVLGDGQVHYSSVVAAGANSPEQYPGGRVGY